MKEYKLPLDSFIGGWFIDKTVCDDLVKYFKDTRKDWQTLMNEALLEYIQTHQ